MKFEPICACDCHKGRGDPGHFTCALCKCDPARPQLKTSRRGFISMLGAGLVVPQLIVPDDEMVTLELKVPRSHALNGRDFEIRHDKNRDVFIVTELFDGKSRIQMVTAQMLANGSIVNFKSPVML